LHYFSVKMNRSDFQLLAKVRLREAKLLLAANAPDGAYYLAGYAVECALKACIAKATKRHDFPDKQRANDSYTHNAKKLIVVAGLESALDEAVRQSEFGLRWKIVLQWNEESRYSSHSTRDALDLIEAVENRKYGILQWLKKHY
jgi:HEPN domain-containing protein